MVKRAGSTQPTTVNLVGVQPHGLGDPQVASGHPLAGADQVVVDSKVAPLNSVLTFGGAATWWSGQSTAAL